MPNLYSNPSLANAQEQSSSGYTSYKEPDTRIPPRAKPVLNKVMVNDVEIPEAEILAEAQHHSAENPGDALEQAAQALVIRELLLQRANELGITSTTPEMVDGKLETETDSLIRHVMDSEVRISEATESECRRYYQNNKERFSTETIYEASHILLAAPEGDEEIKQKQLEKANVLFKLLNEDPKRFAACASEFSACPSKECGGNLGQITKGSTVTEFEQALRSADAPGLLPSPVETRFGFHIIRLDRIIPGRVIPFEHVREKIAPWLEDVNWTNAVSQYLHDLSSKAEISGISLSH